MLINKAFLFVDKVSQKIKHTIFNMQEFFRKFMEELM